MAANLIVTNETDQILSAGGRSFAKGQTVTVKKKRKLVLKDLRAAAKTASEGKSFYAQVILKKGQQKGSWTIKHPDQRR